MKLSQKTLIMLISHILLVSLPFHNCYAIYGKSGCKYIDQSENILSSPTIGCNICPEQKLSEDGFGSVIFQAIGNSFNLNFIQSNESTKECEIVYNINFSKLDDNNYNTYTYVNKPVKSVVEELCKKKDEKSLVITQNSKINYEVVFNKNNKSITININGIEFLKCIDDKFVGNNIKYYDFSCDCKGPSSTEVIILNVLQVYPNC